MNAPKQLVLMALGPDRVGLVAQIAGFIRERGGNVEDSRMAALGSEFGVMVLVSGSEDRLARIEAESNQLPDMSVLVRRTKKPDERREHATVVAEALDHEGIVHAVSTAIERLGVSITSLETAHYPAPLSGGPLFRMKATVELPTSLDLGAFREGLEPVAEDENLDIEVRKLDDAPERVSGDANQDPAVPSP